jgi:hypothetical protein
MPQATIQDHARYLCHLKDQWFAGSSGKNVTNAVYAVTLFAATTSSWSFGGICS